MRALHDDVVKPIALKTTRGALVSCVAPGEPGRSAHSMLPTRRSTKRPLGALGASPGQQRLSADPVCRAGGEWHPYRVRLGDGGLCPPHEITLAKTVVAALDKDMLCLADRAFFGFALWTTSPREWRRSAMAYQEEPAAVA